MFSSIRFSCLHLPFDSRAVSRVRVAKRKKNAVMPRLGRWLLVFLVSLHFFVDYLFKKKSIINSKKSRRFFTGPTYEKKNQRWINYLEKLLFSLLKGGRRGTDEKEEKSRKIKMKTSPNIRHTRSGRLNRRHICIAFAFDYRSRNKTQTSIGAPLLESFRFDCFRVNWKRHDTDGRLFSATALMNRTRLDNHRIFYRPFRVTVGFLQSLSIFCRLISKKKS